MPNPLNRVTGRLLDPFRMHPTSADLIAYRDGELPPGSQARVKNHLQHCEPCQKEANLLEEDFSRFDELTRGIDAGPLADAGLLELQKAMDGRGAEVAQSAPSRLEPGISPRRLASIRAELTIYLGARAAERVLARTRPTTPMPQDMINVIEPLMAGLLGNRGGAAVAGRIALLCGIARTPAPRSVT